VGAGGGTRALQAARNKIRKPATNRTNPSITTELD
jgi:hypothetical protein